jgi:hypothetical protein
MEFAQGPPSHRVSLASTYVTATDEYAAFLKAAYHLDSRRIIAAEQAAALPNAEAVIFLDAKGRIILPPMTPFLPVNFTATPTNKRARLDRMWLDCGALLADEFLKHSLYGPISLPPDFTDLRPFIWKGLNATLRYTFVVDFPYDESQMDSAVRKQIAKTAAAGFVCRRARKSDLGAILGCIHQTEQRQGFSYKVSESILQQGLDIVGEDKFRIYVATAPNGSPASCRIVLHAAGGVAIDWIAATANEHLKSGATQTLIQFALQDVQDSGARMFDFAGAGLPAVSAAKACWGGRLTAYPTIQQVTLKNLAVQMYARLRTGGKPPSAKKRDAAKKSGSSSPSTQSSDASAP